FSIGIKCLFFFLSDNELITLEIIHRYVELLDKYFGSVCELDIIFNFEKAYFILDEFLLGGEAQETSKKNVLKAIEQADLLQEVHACTQNQSCKATEQWTCRLNCCSSYAKERKIQ
uniref:Adaptor related protein complex 1 subunit sigma 2 n=1 Tax=Hippocampus comes TaxID=109280 RepID=A0A3Q3DCW3_HIPCM